MTAASFSEVIYDKAPSVYIFAIYRYSVILWGLSILAREVFHAHDLYRAQIAVIISGFLFQFIGMIMSLINIQLAPQREWIPFTSALGLSIVAWGIFRFRIFEIVPLAREKVFDDMIDPVVILDNQSNIIDINQSMLNLLGMTSKAVIGRPARMVFSEFQIPIKMYAQVSYARTETKVEIGGFKYHFELTVSPFLNEKKQIIGRAYLAHDITAMKDLEKELRNLNMDLEKRVEVRTRELSEVYDTTLEGWAKALELRDKETEGHSRRVTAATVEVARAMDLPEAEIEHIRRGAILHDIGKMAIPDDILHKDSNLTPAERKIIEQHPTTALNMLEGIPYLKRALDIPYCHHERWDGSGYPRGLKGRQIPIGARIFAVADVWDALRSERPYNSKWSQVDAVEYLVEQAGKHFDPRVVNIFLDLVEQGKI